jgi:protein-tyrosine phosphatase
VQLQGGPYNQVIARPADSAVVSRSVGRSAPSQVHVKSSLPGGTTLSCARHVQYDCGSLIGSACPGGEVQIRSSITHPLQIAELATSLSGSIGVTFCPGKCGPSLYGHIWKRDLEADLNSIERWGAQIVLTLVELCELQALEVATLGQKVQSRGMRWLHLPIVDVSIPTTEFEGRWREELPGLLVALKHGGKVLVHCKGGLGRAGMVAAFLLIESGDRPEAAIRKVRRVRPGAIETAAQERYVLGYQPRGSGR